MSVTKEVRDFISNSLAENNRALLTQISKLVSDSAENLKRANAEAADEQLRQVKKLRREEPKSSKRKGNEIQYKFNSKLQDSLEEAKTHLETNAVEKAKESLTEGTLLLTNRQKLVLLADKSEFGWKTVEEYSQHELRRLLRKSPQFSALRVHVLLHLAKELPPGSVPGVASVIV